MNFRMAFVLGIIASLFLLAGCVDKDLSKKEAPEGSGDYFDFRTANKLTAEVKYDVPKGYEVFFEAYVEYPVDTINGRTVKKENLKPLFRGFTDENGEYSETVQVPTYVNEIYLYSASIAVPMVKTLEVSRGRSMVSRAGEDGYVHSTYPAGMKVIDGMTWNDKGVPSNLGGKKDISAGGLIMLNATLKMDDSNVSDYIVKNSEANLNVIKDGATVDVVVINNSGNTRTNTVGYYYYSTNNPPQTAEEVQRIILFPNATFPEKGGLQLGDNVRLKYWEEVKQEWRETFPAGVTIGWFILAGGYDANNHTVVDVARGRSIGFSNTSLNTEQRSHTIIVRDPNTKVRYVGLEDQNFNSSPVYRDFIFSIDADDDHVEYNDGSMPDGKDMTDTDGDGVPDVDDEFPNDGSVAYSMTYEGTLAYEDIWPYQGDYDMNDMVVEYHIKHFLNKGNLLVRVEDSWTVKNVGAQLQSGFGYQYGFRKYKVGSMSVETTYPGQSRFAKDAKGLEYAQPNDATIILFDSALDVINAPEDQRTFTVKMTLNVPTKTNELELPPYNPFIIVNTNEGRGHEVHLPNYKPTGLMDTKLLHYGHDLSDPEKGIYFVSDNNFPFAIHIINESLDLKSKDEGKRIDVIYPQFSKWASSFGEENKEWYKHKK